MPEPMPVVRQTYWPALIPQFVAIGALAALAHRFLLRDSVALSVAVGAFSYFVCCRVLRATLATQHIRGMMAYHGGRFGEAIDHFQASYGFFKKHRGLDACRWLIFGVASRYPYSILALGNMAYCYGQLGEGAKAIELYEQALAEAPGYKLAQASLNMLRASVPKAAQGG